MVHPMKKDFPKLRCPALNAMRALLFTLLLVSGSGIAYGEGPATLSDPVAQEPNDSVKVDQLYQLSFQYFSSNPDTSLKLLEEGLELADQLGYRKGHINILSGLGYYGIVRGNLTYALDYLNQAMDEAEKYGIEVAKGSIRNGLGLVYAELDDYPKALEYYQQAFDQFITAGDSARALNILANMGVIQCKQMNYPRGIDYFNQVLDFADNSSNTYLRLQILGVMANAYAGMGEHEKAERYFLEGLNTAETLNIPLEIGLNAGNLGKEYFLTGKIDSSITYTKKAIEVLEKLDAQHFLVSNYANLARCYAIKGYFTLSEEYAKKAETIAKKIGSFEKESYALNAFADLYEKQNNYSKANYYLRQLISIKDSMNSSEQRDKIADLETKFNVRQKEREIELLHKESEISLLKISKQRQTIWSLAGGVVLLLIFSTLLYRLFKRKEQANRDLIRKNLELMKAEEHVVAFRRQDPNKYMEARKEELINEFEILMHQQGLYRQSGITLEIVAERLNSNRTYLSGMINSHFHTNFTTLINRYRIGEARRLLVSPAYKNYTIEAIANEVGFISKSSFNEAFKKETGLTPSFFQHHTGKEELLIEYRN